MIMAKYAINIKENVVLKQIVYICYTESLKVKMGCFDMSH